MVKMTTNVPSINIGGANLTLQTDPNNELGRLIGGSSAQFVILQQFNGFAAAHMDVTTISAMTQLPKTANPLVIKTD